jgi:hypothetical protein
MNEIKRQGNLSKSHPPKVLSDGTELPLIDLKGKPYLQVAHRIVWFRLDHPNGRINTEILVNNEKYALVKATIMDKDGLLLATAHKVEHLAHFQDYLEKSETSAIGRALALCGYGTQFEPELDEGARIVDAPQEPAKKAGAAEGFDHLTLKEVQDLAKYMVPRNVSKEEVEGYIKAKFDLENMRKLHQNHLSEVYKFIEIRSTKGE